METRADRRRNNQIMNVLKQAKRLAQTYRQLTGKPLGITGEVAEYEAARILRGLTLAPRGRPAMTRSKKSKGGAESCRSRVDACFQAVTPDNESAE